MARTDADIASLLAVACEAGTSQADTEMVLTSFAMLRSDFLQASSSMKYYADHPHAGSPSDPGSAAPGKYATDIDRFRRGMTRLSQEPLRRAVQKGTVKAGDIPSREAATAQVVSIMTGRTSTAAPSIAPAATPGADLRTLIPSSPPVAAPSASKARSTMPVASPDEQLASDIVSAYLGTSGTLPAVSKSESDEAAKLAAAVMASDSRDSETAVADPEAVKLASVIVNSYSASRGSKS
ncbi:MAG: hypothetical protein JWO28_2639 [Hyphomicrobiales bacterium]|nr:hypothetical protein [Hyphomicrobiales bacterium]